MEEITVDYVKHYLTPTFKRIESDIDQCIMLKKKQDNGKYLQLIMSRLRVIFGLTPSYREDEIENIYFNQESGLKNLQERFEFILSLQDMICCETGLPFIYDRFTILKILRLSMNKYNEIIDSCNEKSYIFDEDIANLFIDIETMLLSDRNNSAENGTKNFKAIDSVNKYKKSSGGFGVLVEKEQTTSSNEKVLVITAEETQKKLHNFNFSSMLENQQAQEQEQESKKASSGANNKKSKK